MTLGPNLLARLVGAAIAAAVGAGAALASGGGGRSLEAKVDQLIEQQAGIRSDLRLLKCKAGFPGDCPR